MPDIVTETTRTSYFGRVGNSFKGILIGILLFLGSFAFLFWNEGNFVKVSKGLDEGRGSVVELPSPSVDSANEGKLIYTTGNTEAGTPLTDEQFMITSQALMLTRTVEMYQWQEEQESESRESLGGTEETTTTYTYTKSWQKNLNDSSSFKEQTGHENPSSMPYDQNEIIANDAKLGEYTLSSSVIKKLGNAQPVTPDTFNLTTVPNAQFSGNYIYIGSNPSQPAVGDVRISFAAILPGPASVIAQQNGTTFGPYTTKTGSTIELVSSATQSADQMFTAAEQANHVLTWIFRGLGFLAMWIGLSLIFGPLSMIFAFIPFLRGLVGAVVGIAAFIVALLLSALTIAIAWLFYRPLISIAILSVVGIIAYLVKTKILDKRQSAIKPAEPVASTEPIATQTPTTIQTPATPVQPPTPQPAQPPTDQANNPPTQQ